MKVSFYEVQNGERVKVGSISLHGSQLVLDPPSSQKLREAAESPIRVRQGWLTPDADPKEWLEALPFAYRGSYSWAELEKSS